MIKLNVIRNIGRSSGRNLLTMTGIAVGVFAVVLISSLGETGTQMISGTMNEMGINSVMIQAAGDNSEVYLSDEDIRAVSDVRGVSKAMPLMSTMTDTVLIDSSVSCIAWGVDKNAKDIISLRAAYGRLINDGDVQSRAKVCVVDEEMAKSTYGRGNIVGKFVRINLGGEYESFRVIGVARSGISSLQSSLSGVIPSFVYVPYTVSQHLTGRSGYDKIAVLVGADSDGAVIERIENRILESRSKGSVVVANLLGQKQQLESVMSTIKIVLSLIAGISLLVSGITIMTTMLVNVGERTAEIGIKKSIGAKSGAICFEFLTESITVTAAVALFGIMLGFLFTVIGCAGLGISPSIDYPLILAAFGAAIATGALFGAYPSLKAARMQPAEALRAGR